MAIEQDRHRRADCRDRSRRRCPGEQMAVAGRGGSAAETGRRAAAFTGHPQLDDRGADRHLARCNQGRPGGGSPPRLLRQAQHSDAPVPRQCRYRLVGRARSVRGGRSARWACHLHHVERIVSCSCPNDESRWRRAGPPWWFRAPRLPGPTRWLSGAARRLLRSPRRLPWSSTRNLSRAARRSRRWTGTGCPEPNREHGRAARRYQRQRDADSPGAPAARVAIGP